MFIIFVDVVGSMFSMCFYPVCCLLILPTCDACSLYMFPIMLQLCCCYYTCIIAFTIGYFALIFSFTLHGFYTNILTFQDIFSILYAYYYSNTYFFPNDSMVYSDSFLHSLLACFSSLYHTYISIIHVILSGMLTPIRLSTREYVYVNLSFTHVNIFVIFICIFLLIFLTHSTHENIPRLCNIHINIFTLFSISRVIRYS